jgi:hypothetical protein
MKNILGANHYACILLTALMAPVCAKVIEKDLNVYFGSKPRQRYSSPLDKGDHPVLETSEFLMRLKYRGLHL